MPAGSQNPGSARAPEWEEGRRRRSDSIGRNGQVDCPSRVEATLHLASSSNTSERSSTRTSSTTTCEVPARSGSSTSRRNCGRGRGQQEESEGRGGQWWGGRRERFIGCWPAALETGRPPARGTHDPLCPPPSPPHTHIDPHQHSRGTQQQLGVSRAAALQADRVAHGAAERLATLRRNALLCVGPGGGGDKCETCMGYVSDMTV